MAYDEHLGERIRNGLRGRAWITERQMFGGLAFMLKDHMFCGVIGDDLVVRLGDEGGKKALARPHTRPMDFSGRPMTGYVYVAPEGTKTARQLSAWVDKAAAFVETLPPKKAKKRQ